MRVINDSLIIIIIITVSKQRNADSYLEAEFGEANPSSEPRQSGVDESQDRHEGDVAGDDSRNGLGSNGSSVGTSLKDIHLSAVTTKTSDTPIHLDGISVVKKGGTMRGHSRG